MADVIVGAKIVDCKIRLEMNGNHFVDIAVHKSCLIAVDIIRTFVYRFPVFVNNRRMKNIVVIEQSDIISRRHLVAFVGIAGYALVFLKFPVYDS